MREHVIEIEYLEPGHEVLERFYPERDSGMWQFEVDGADKWFVSGHGGRVDPDIGLLALIVDADERIVEIVEFMVHNDRYASYHVRVTDKCPLCGKE